MDELYQILCGYRFLVELELIPDVDCVDITQKELEEEETQHDY